MNCKFDWNNKEISNNGECQFCGECVKVLQSGTTKVLAEEINELTHRNKYTPIGPLLYDGGNFFQKMHCNRMR